jgi:D-glycero-D-manno-heptose 1,7-bisphosphate phosphatase
VRNSKGRRAVFLDRDGVINRGIIVGGKTYAPKEISAFEFLPGVSEACEALVSSGFLIVVITNQPDVGRGFQSRDTVEKMHKLIYETLPVHKIFSCFHAQDEGCGCRKPQPGHFYQAADDFGIDLRESYMVGDRASDMLASYRCGCTGYFIDYDLAEPKPEVPHTIVDSLKHAAEKILAQGKI